MKIGVDAGSKTVKIVALDQDNHVAFSLYRRHHTDIKTTLVMLLEDTLRRIGDCECTVGFTGSAGIDLAKTLDVPFAQEVEAVCEAVAARYEDIDCIVELGGEDSKIIYLNDPVEQRMNAVCAGGTGGFVDTIAFMLHVRSQDINSLAEHASCVYPIASRCAVFAQTDVRPLLNEGATKEDIAASALNAVVRQTLSGLACGRPISGKVVFLGGPIEFMPALVRRYRDALGLTQETGIKPADAHLFAACGAALYAAREGVAGGFIHRVKLSTFLHSVQNAGGLQSDSLERLEPLFSSEEQKREFFERHSCESVPSCTMDEAEGPFFLGFDAGSTTIKCVLMDNAGRVVLSDYQPVNGDVLDTAITMLTRLLDKIPNDKYGGANSRYIVQSAVTGYGEELLCAGLGFDSGIVETTAHFLAARHYQPNVSFVLDIGGQDMKALWIENGLIRDASLNEACSSGCGAFLEGSAYSLRSRPSVFAQKALEATNPIDFGTKCTVFMTSRVRHAQKVGATAEDIAAGLAYSVVRNALYRIIGVQRLDQLGDCIVVQGGTFKSDAVLRAFEVVTGARVHRPAQAHLMGALGAAIAARQRYWARYEGVALSKLPRGHLLDARQLSELNIERTISRCSGCENACRLSIVLFGNGEMYLSGNRCSRARQFVFSQGQNRDARSEANAVQSLIPRGTHDFKLPPDLQGRTPSEIAAYLERQLKHSESPAMPNESNGNLANGSVRADDLAVERRAPNVVRLAQGLLKRYGDVSGSRRSQIKVGLMNTMHSFVTLPFWHAFFASLGFAIVVPDDARAQKYLNSSYESIPSESVCQPAKLSHLRLYDLMHSDVQTVFVPTYVRGRRCPVSCAYAEVLQDNCDLRSNELAPHFETPLLENIDPSKIISNERDRHELFSCVKNIAAEANPVCPEEFNDALIDGLSAYEAFRSTIAMATRKAIDWTRAKADNRIVILAGRPYHIDEALLHGIDREIQQLGHAVVPLLGFGDYGDGEYWVGDIFRWDQGERIARAAGLARELDRADFVGLRSFNCGFDAVSFDAVHSECVKNNEPFTELKIDDIVDISHLRIRLRTLLETSEMRASLKCNASGEVSGGRASTGRSASEVEKSAEREIVLSQPLNQNEIAIAREEVTPDLCFTAAALSGKAIRAIRENEADAELVIPRICSHCLVDAIPFEVEKTCHITPAIRWLEQGLVRGGYENRIVKCQRNASGPRPLIGIVGNQLLCSDDLMNDGIVHLLTELGCDVACPDESLLLGDDVRYLDQLDMYYRLGVNQVIYLQSFGCLKVHVYGRGALHGLTKRYPGMPITIIDYDPETSALNRENRIRLVVASAKRKLIHQESK